MPGLLHLLRRTLLTWACLPALAVAQSVPAVDPLPVETQLGLHLRDLGQSWEVIQGRSARPQQPVSSKQLSLPDDATCRQRLSSIQGVFVFDMYPRVRDFIEFFALRNAEGLEAVLGMSQQYKPGIERSLQQFNLPLNLRFLPIALSAMNTCALSEHGSAGLWQLNHYVAIRYGLQCTDAVDERRDFHRSTHAAMAYLSDLQKHYGNWMHTLTAFTNGPAALQRALLRSQGKTDFGSLYPHLPTEARDCVPAFVAACYLAAFSQDLGIERLQVSLPQSPDYIQLQQPLGFKALSKVLKIPMDQLRQLNPVCRMEYIPGLSSPVQLCLPNGFGAKFSELRDSIYNVQAGLDKAEAAEAAKATPLPEAAATTDSGPGDPAEGGAVKAGDEARANAFIPPPGTVPTKYTIQPGDNLGKIAQDHGVTVSHLMAANNLRNANIRAGDVLTIYLPKFTQKPPLGPGPKLPNVEGSPKNTPTGFVWYTVKSGDNLWSIARKYPGVTEQDIMRLNGMGDKLQPGMKIKVPTKKP